MHEYSNLQRYINIFSRTLEFFLLSVGLRQNWKPFISDSESLVGLSFFGHCGLDTVNSGREQLLRRLLLIAAGYGN